MVAALSILLSHWSVTLILTLIFLCLNVLDGHSTYLVLKPDHYERERNPVARWMFRKLKIPQGIIIFKTFLLSLLVVCIGYYAAYDALTINLAIGVGNILFILVLRHNYRVWHKFHKAEEELKVLFGDD